MNERLRCEALLMDQSSLIHSRANSAMRTKEECQWMIERVSEAMRRLLSHSERSIVWARVQAAAMHDGDG